MLGYVISLCIFVFSSKQNTMNNTFETYRKLILNELKQRPFEILASNGVIIMLCTN